MEAIKRFFAAPKFDDPLTTISASLLNFITIAYFVVSSFVIGLAILVAPTAPTQTLREALVVVTPVVLILIISQVLMRRGKVRQASAFFAVTHWLSVTWGVYVGGGVIAPGLFNYILSILIFGLLLGNRFAAYSAVASLGAAAIALILDNQGLLPEPVIEVSPEANLLTFVVLVLLVTTFLYLFLQRLTRLRREQEATQHELELARSDLERRVIEATEHLTLAAQVGREISLLQGSHFVVNVPQSDLPFAAALIVGSILLHPLCKILSEPAGSVLRW